MGYPRKGILLRNQPLGISRGQRPIQAQLRRRRQSRALRRLSRHPRINRGSVAPPPLSLTSNTTTLWLRTIQKQTLDKSTYNVKWNPSLNAVVGAPWSALASLFAEIKILRLNVYLYTRNQPFGTASGIHTLGVTDYQEIDSNANVRDFSSISAQPGSMTRRITQPLHGVWFPTEPTDRDWHPFTTSSNLCDVFYASDGREGELNVDVFFDAHIKLRGLKNIPSIQDFRLSTVPGVINLDDLAMG